MAEQDYGIINAQFDEALTDELVQIRNAIEEDNDEERNYKLEKVVKLLGSDKLFDQKSEIVEALDDLIQFMSRDKNDMPWQGSKVDDDVLATVVRRLEFIKESVGSATSEENIRDALSPYKVELIARAGAGDRPPIYNEECPRYSDEDAFKAKESEINPSSSPRPGR